MVEAERRGISIRWPGRGWLRLFATLALATLTALAHATTAEAGPADLDPGFGGDGKVITDAGGSEIATGVALQPDGKIVAVGSTAKGGVRRLLLLRYGPDGTLDPSFSDDGIVTTQFFGNTQGAAVTIDAEGRIIAVGTSATDEDNVVAVARYLPDGGLDESFGKSGGRLTVGIPNRHDVGHSVALQPDGKVVIAGQAISVTDASDSDFSLFRLSSDGSLDGTFDGNGMLTTDFGRHERALDVAIDSAGKITAVGPFVSGDDIDVALFRVNPDGSPDLSFGDGTGPGKSLVNLGGDRDPATALAIQGDGKLLVAGGGQTTPFTVARFTANGSVDAGFGSFGQSRLFGGEYRSLASDVLVQPDGMIVAAGRVQPSFGRSEMGLARLNPDGSPDSGFGDGGTARVIFGANNQSARSVALQPDGKLVAAGSMEGAGGGSDVVLARLGTGAGGGPGGGGGGGDPESGDTRVVVHFRGKVMRVGRQGLARVRIACPFAEVSPPCQLALALRTAKKIRFKGKKRRVGLGRARLRIGAGQVRYAKVKLSRKTLRLLRRSRQARKVRAKADVRDSVGNRSTKTKVLRVRFVKGGR